MVFRADEAADDTFEGAKRYLITNNLPPEEWKESERALRDIIDECGPVVHDFPTWHPLVSNHAERYHVTRPKNGSGYQGLDHTLSFVQGFITCPYNDGQDVIDSVNSMPQRDYCAISAERLDMKFYMPQATPILVKCEWERLLPWGRQIPKSLAVPLMIEYVLPSWRWSKYAEPWEIMRPYLLGEPHGSRSSLFVEQETGMAIKKAYLAMVNSGMFGSLRLD